MYHLNEDIVVENWIKPPKIVQYTNSHLKSYDGKTLICEFMFPHKYSFNDFYIFGEKVLNSGDMFYGRRYFYCDRYFSLLEFYSKDRNITAYYIDLSLPALIMKEDLYKVAILDIKLDFFIMPDKKKHYILDEDEYKHAIDSGFFTGNEISACNRTKDFILRKIQSESFDLIFKDYEKTDASEWNRYADISKTLLLDR